MELTRRHNWIPSYSSSEGANLLSNNKTNEIFGDSSNNDKDDSICNDEESVRLLSEVDDEEEIRKNVKKIKGYNDVISQENENELPISSASSQISKSITGKSPSRNASSPPDPPTPSMMRERKSLMKGNKQEERLSLKLRNKVLNKTKVESCFKIDSCFETNSGIIWHRNQRHRCLGRFWRGTLHVMNILAGIVLWGSIGVMVTLVVWYTRELINNGTDPHLIAWFSAGAFVLLGFPISMYGIIMHLSNYYHPNIQCYVVRILWMVPFYSIESWLCLRFHEFAVYIETLRDCYESYVLYCFLQYLIEVLGGEEELTLMLKDKSPTRGVHFSPLNCCWKPWIMGQPIAKRPSMIQWKSPFFIKCKFGVLQYVLLKTICSLLTMILELNGVYNEGDFSPKTGYLYICIITNTSQCWALYCLAFFYYATKNELSPIRPVGKFLSVKAIVFFTWWQSLFISILYQLGFIPDYNAQRPWSAEAVAKGLQDYLICIEMFVGAIVHVFVFPHTDYLVTGGFSAGNRNNSKHGPKHHRIGKKHKMYHQLHHVPNRKKYESPDSSKHRQLNLKIVTSDEAIQSKYPSTNYQLISKPNTTGLKTNPTRKIFNEPIPIDLEDINVDENFSSNISSDELLSSDDEEGIALSEGVTLDEDNLCQPSTNTNKQKAGFVHAFLDSAMPRDVVDNTVSIVKGEYTVQKKTLLHHATTSDEYAIFQKQKRQKFLSNKKPAVSNEI